jgi:hypothetical protein
MSHPYEQRVADLHRVALLTLIDRIGLRYDELFPTTRLSDEEVKMTVERALDRHVDAKVAEAELRQHIARMTEPGVEMVNTQFGQRPRCKNHRCRECGETSRHKDGCSLRLANLSRVMMIDCAEGAECFWDLPPIEKT